MLNDHNNSIISVLESCWPTSSSICSSVDTSQKKERNIYQNYMYDM